MWQNQGSEPSPTEDGGPQPLTCSSDILISYCWEKEIITRRHNCHEAPDV